MALNQVIHGSNRVVENPNRYKLNAVAGQANTYDLEKQPGVITDNGTPYSKLILDKIDNVLSYLTPSVEKVEGIYEVEKRTLYVNNVDTSLSENTQVDFIDVSMENIETSQPKLTIIPNSNFIDMTSGTGQFVSTYIRNGNTTKYYTNSIMSNVLKRTSYTSNYFINHQPNSHNFVYYEYDFIGKSSFTFNYHFNNTAEFEVSDDKINWNNIGTAQSDIDSQIVSNTKHRYFRFKTPESSSFSLYYAYFTNIKSDVLTYQNQFTLDNNTSFTNNQRVLVETAPNYEEVEKTYNENLLATNITPTWENSGDIQTKNINMNIMTFDEITPIKTWKSNKDFYISSTSSYDNDHCHIAVYSNGSKVFNSTAFLDNEILTTNTSGYYNQAFFNSNANINLSILYDMKVPCKPTFKYRLDLYQVTNYKIQGSNDGIIWEDLASIEPITSTTFTSTQYYRYYRFYVENSTTTETGYVMERYIYISNVIYKKNEPAPYKDVTSNTLNGIEIPTLLQPSTKYELIYKEGTNKFEFGNLTEKQPLFDITLMEAVNQVDLTGISDMLEVGKLYALYIIGSVSTSGTIKFGQSNCGSLESSPYRSFNIIFAPFIDNSNIKRVSYMCAINSQFQYINSEITDNEYIKCDTNSTTFNAGTRIVIKEVD